jgi:hypothetical protein
VAGRAFPSWGTGQDVQRSTMPTTLTIGATGSHSADDSVLQKPYVLGSMQTFSSDAVFLRSPDPRRVLCTRCEHTEFVHSDSETRHCLYSECDCSGFTTGAVA